MRNLVCQSFVSLDGVINHMERWHFDYADDESNTLALDQLRASDGLLMGRRTYEVYAAAWPSRQGDYPELINRLPKYVVSSTLTDPAWQNTTVLARDPIDAIDALKQEDGRQLLMHGYGPLAKELLAAGILDELHLWVHPVMAGIGEGDDLLLQEGLHRVLRFDGSTALQSGVLILRYRNDVPQGSA